MIKRFFKYNTLLVFFFMSFMQLRAQEDFSSFEYNPKSKFGLNLGLGVSALRGGNLKEPRPYVGYNAGFYHHLRLKDRHYAYYECALNFLGGNFRTNPDSLTYSKISLFYVGLPISYMYRLGRDEKKPFFLMAGASGSLLVKSSMLLGPNPIPTYFDLPLKTGNVAVHLGFHKFFGSVGIQFKANVGLTNINRNRWAGYEDVKPSLDQRKPIQTLNFTTGLIF